MLIYEDERRGPDHQRGPLRLRSPINFCGQKVASLFPELPKSGIHIFRSAGPNLLVNVFSDEYDFYTELLFVGM